MTRIEKAAALLLAGAPLLAAGCGDNPITSPGEPVPFRVTIENVSAAGDFSASGSFSVPVTARGGGPIGPGQAYEFEFGALPGSKLSFATMFVHSNDLFYAPDEGGIDLFDGSDQPVSGDVTSQVRLWDAGTEMNEEPGVGPNQAPRQPAPDTGPADANATVRLVSDAYTYPAVADVIGVTLTPLGDNLFRARIENRSMVGTLVTSTMQSLAVPLAPGVFVVHTGSSPLFTAGGTSSAGLEALAEDGINATLGADVASRTSIATPLAPGVFAVHDVGMPLFTSGSADRGEGLEALAEDGDPSGLAASVAANPIVGDSGAFDTPDGAGSPGPLLPGGSYSFTFEAFDGDYLSFATMFVQSNDWFYSPADGGLALFSGGQPITGDVTNGIGLWDSGTEIDQWPGVGPDQAPRQVAANTGASDPTAQVRPADAPFPRPAVDEVIRVTVTVR